MHYLRDLASTDTLKQKTVFVRADLNVPIDKNGVVRDSTRIEAVIPTLRELLTHKARIVLASHLGRPKGKAVPALSLAPVADELGKLLSRPVKLAPDCVGPAVQQMVSSLQAGEICLLENLRFHPEEESNDPQFSAQLGALADVYVNDAFATAHRSHASTVGITSHIPLKAAGLTVEHELKNILSALESPAKPLVVIFGGVKVSTKMSAIKNVARQAQRIIVGGAMANTFLAARGNSLGASLLEPEQFESARECEKLLAENDCELILPVDFVAAEKLQEGVDTRVMKADSVEDGWMALDIGPESQDLFCNALSGAKTIIWNGPVGAFETTGFEQGTYSLVDAVVKSAAFRLVGGGDTDRALHARNAFDKLDYVSTAGGAFLAMLEGEQLPALKALND